MARIKLDLPEHFVFSTEISIGIGSINYGGHMGNDAALTLLHEARIRFIHSLGFTELDIAGRGLIQSDAALVYKAEAFWGDVLVVDIALDDFNKYGCDLYYRVRRPADGRDILHAKTGMLFFNYDTRKPASIPKEFVVALQLEISET
ncbi:MAG: thioesterase family protein [Burkholderiales bacterium]|nr:thioesterase family protein [Burkholderiales bacterium]